MVETPSCDSSNDQKHNSCVCSCMNEFMAVQVYVYVLVHIHTYEHGNQRTTLGTIYLLFGDKVTLTGLDLDKETGWVGTSPQMYLQA